MGSPRIGGQSFLLSPLPLLFLSAQFGLERAFTFATSESCNFFVYE